MSADIVTPIAVEHVGGRRIEVRQEFQALPRDKRVAREAYLIAVIAESAPAMIEHRALVAVTLHIGKPDVVTPEHIVERGDTAIFLPLLPVDPPEIDTIGHIVVEISVEDGLDITLVGAEPLVGLTVAFAEPLHESLILLLVGAHAIGRMQVHRGLHALLVEILEESLVVGEESFVPVPACPASTSLRTDGVPVHIDDEHVEGQVELLEIADKVAEILIAVTPVAAPPVAEGVARRQGHLASELGV